MLSRRGAFSQGHSMRLPPTHVGQQADDIPPHLQKLWQAHKAVATVKALSEISKPGGISRVGEFAFGMHLHPGNTAFGRQYTRGLAEHGAGQKAQTSGSAPAKSRTPDKNSWGAPTGTSQPGAIPKPFEPTKAPKKSAAGELHAERRKTQADKARLDEEKAQADHARNLEILAAKAGLAASKTAPKSVQFSSTPEQTPPSAGPKYKQPQLPLEYVKSEPKTGKGAFFAKHAEREKTWGDVNRKNPKDFIK